MSTELEKQAGQEIISFSEKASKKNLGLIDGIENEVKVVPFTDIESHLKSLVKKHKNFKVTEENYNKEGKEIEREFRETRYKLQNWRSETGSKLEAFKKTEFKKIDDLIEFIKPFEETWKADIKSIEDKIKERKEQEKKKEQERVEKIEKLIDSYNSFFLEMLASSNSIESLPLYNQRLDLLREDIDSGMFFEWKYKAERIEATYLGRRSEIEERIKSKEREEQERIERERKEREEQDKRQNILIFRREQLENLGFSFADLVYRHKSGVEVLCTELEDADEIDFFNIIFRLKKEIEDKEKESKEREEQERNRLIVEYKKLIEVLKELGGRLSFFELEEGSVPSVEQTEKLIQAIKTKKKEKEQLKVSDVKKEITPFIQDLKDSVESFKVGLSKKELKNEESKNILERVLLQMEEALIIDFGA